MNFTCNGIITRLTFLGWLSDFSGQFDVTRLTSWPYFSLWHCCEDPHNHHYFWKRAEIGPTDHSQLSVSMQNGNNVLMILTTSGSVSFNEGDILGVRLQPRAASIANGITISLVLPDQTLVNYYYNYWYYYYGIQPDEFNICSQPFTDRYQGRPYICIITSRAVCASGFIRPQSILRNLLAPSRSSFLHFPGIPPPAMSMPFTDCGLLTHIFIAAKFNKTVSVSGWPELQIIRMVNNRTCVAFTTNTYNNNIMMGPQQTSHHNVYEYDLSTHGFIIQAGDVLNISWYGDVLQLDQIRFSLAYYDNGVPPGIPMVSVEMTNSNCSSQHTSETVTDNPLTTSSMPINIKNNITISQSNATISVIISGVVSCSLLFSLVLFTPNSRCHNMCDYCKTKGKILPSKCC